MTLSSVIYDPDGQFESLADGESATDSFDTVSDGNGGTATATVTVTVDGVNDAPAAVDDGPSGELTTDEDTLLSVNGVLDNDTDPDTSDTLAVTKVADTEAIITGGGGTAVNGAVTLASGALLNMDADGTFTYDANGQFESLASGDSNTDNFAYEASDGNGGTDTATTTITIDGVNDPPVITSSSSASVVENQTGASDVGSSDPEGETEGGGGLTYLFSTTIDGVDNGLFSIDANSGVVTFSAAPDFEAPGDADSGNDHEGEVTVSDVGGLTGVGTFTVSVTDVNEAPSITSSGSPSVVENQTGASDVGSSDPEGETEGGGGLTYGITGGADQGLFSIDANSGVLTFDAAPDFEAPGDADSGNDYEVQVTVSDTGQLTGVQDLTVSVTNVNEAPTAVDDSFTGLPVNVLLDAGGVTTSGTEVNDAEHVLTKGTDDSDPEGTALTVTMVQATAVPGGGSASTATTGGGSVTMSSDGTFTYVSEAGETDATDTFDYTISDGSLTDVGTVTITFGDTIWFIDNSVTGGGNDGRSNSPFESISAFNGATTGTGDTIFLFSGTYTDDGIDLEDSQILVGEESGLTSGNLSIASGTAPELAPATDNGINLASGNTVRGLDIGDTAAGHALSGGAVGTLTVSDVAVSGSGGSSR